MPRKQHSYHYIYKTTCNVTGKFYVGMHSTSELEDNYIGSGKRLWLSIRKHGREKHSKEILEFLESREKLKKREKEIVNEKFIANPLCMNLQPGGEGGFVNKEHQKKCSKAGKNAYNEKLKTSAEFRNHISEIRRNVERKFFEKGKMKFSPCNWKGRHHTEEGKKNISNSLKVAQKGEKNSQFGTLWICNEILSENKKIKITDSIPEGWKRGRIRRSQ
jgi:hypothetical protein